MSTTPSEPEKAAGADPKLPADQQVAVSAAAAAEEGWLGTGAPRYAPHREDAPPSGSEESWSAAPDPGFQEDPDSGVSGNRLAAGLLVGAVVLATGVWAGYAVLTAKSPNGNGSASWTAAQTQDGAVVQGINAQNDVKSGSGLVGAEDQQIKDATAVCDAATGNPQQLTATTGTVPTLGDWTVASTATVAELKAAATSLETAIFGDDITGMATSARNVCTVLAKTSALPAAPDPAAAQDWAAAITAYASAANNALKFAGGDKSALTPAEQGITEGNNQLAALSARIIAAQ